MASDSIYRLARFYIQTDETSCRQSIGRVLQEFVTMTGVVLATYELNYQSGRRFNIAVLENDLSSLAAGDFEHLSVMERQGAKGLHVGSWFRPLGISDVYQYLFAYRSPADFAAEFQSLATTLGSIGALLTGYGRTLTENFEPANESRMKRTWFGNLTTDKGLDPIAEWLEHPRGILQGATKGIYGLNLISDRRPKPPEWLGADALRRAVRVDHAYLAQFSPADLRTLRDRKELKAFVREDAR